MHTSRFDSHSDHAHSQTYGTTTKKKRSKMQTFLLFLVKIFFSLQSKKKEKKEKVFVSEMKKTVDTNFIHTMQIAQKKMCDNYLKILKSTRRGNLRFYLKIH